MNDRRYVFHFRSKPNIWPEKHLPLGRTLKSKPNVQIYVKICVNFQNSFWCLDFKCNWRPVVVWSLGFSEPHTYSKNSLIFFFIWFCEKLPYGNFFSKFCRYNFQNNLPGNLFLTSFSFESFIHFSTEEPVFFSLTFLLRRKNCKLQKVIALSANWKKVPRYALV